MAPLLESEDEISEIEEAIAEAFIISSAKNSPLIERKESTNVVVLNCDSSKFQADATNMTNCENDCNSSMNMIDKGGTGKVSLDITVNATNSNSSSVSEEAVLPSISKVQMIEDQENIRPDKLKAKNKLNLKLNFHKPLEDKNGAAEKTNSSYPAMLNLPSPAKCLAPIDKATTKIKRDNKMRVRMSNRKGKNTSNVSENDKITKNEILQEDVTGVTNDACTPMIQETGQRNFSDKNLLDEDSSKRVSSNGIDVEMKSNVDTSLSTHNHSIGPTSSKINGEASAADNHSSGSAMSSSSGKEIKIL